MDILTYEDSRIITNNAECPYGKLESRINSMEVVERADLGVLCGFSGSQVPDDGRRGLPGHGGTQGEGSPGKKLQRLPVGAVFPGDPSRGIDKAQSLERLLEVSGLSREQMIACGDGYNDLSMIRYAGLGVAMENAVLPVRKAADHITAPSTTTTESQWWWSSSCWRRGRTAVFINIFCKWLDLKTLMC